jgi:hypothetical protein
MEHQAIRGQEPPTMTTTQLKAMARKVKAEIKDWVEDFKAREGREPEKSDKDAIRSKYEAFERLQNQHKDVRRVQEASPRRVQQQQQQEEEEGPQVEGREAAMAMEEDGPEGGQPPGDELLHGILSPEEVQQLTGKFKKAVKQLGADSLDVIGFRSLVKAMSKESDGKGGGFKVPSNRDLDAAFRVADVDQSNGVDLHEFIELFAKVKSGSEVGQSRSGSFLGKLFSATRAKAAKRSAALHEGTVASNEEMDGGVYSGARNAKGQRHGAGTFRWSEGDPEGRTEYAGAWKGGLRHGEGAQKWANGGSYSGAWVRDAMEGVGTFETPSGQCYEGGWRANNKHGQGTMRWPSGDAFVGEWEDGLPSGRGTKTWADQASYAGEWHEGKKHGHGTQIWGEGPHRGDTYVGEWLFGKRTGQGEFTSAKGRRYVGHWEDDKKNGRGTEESPNGRLYTGEWKDNKQSGMGKVTWTKGQREGDFYEGDWVDGEPSGEGSYYAKQGFSPQAGNGGGGGGGCLSTGPFVEGKKNGSHEEKHDNGAVYDVEYDHDRELSRKKRDG